MSTDQNLIFTKLMFDVLCIFFEDMKALGRGIDKKSNIKIWFLLGNTDNLLIFGTLTSSVMTERRIYQKRNKS